MNKEKLIKQLFVGKVSDIIGFKKTTKLLKEATDEINAIIKRKNERLDEQEYLTKHISEVAEAFTDKKSNEEMLKSTIDQIIKLMKKDCLFIANYPSSPRKMELSFNELKDILGEYFDVASSELNVYSLYDYLIEGTKKSVKIIINDMYDELFSIKD